MAGDNLFQVNSILIHWGLTAKKARKIRSAWRAETGQGFKCLKQNNLAPDSSDFVLNLMLYLEKQGFRNFERLNVTPGNLLSVNVNNLNYILTDWITGSEVNLKNPEQVRETGRAYAEFHLAAQGYRCQIPMHNHLGQWPSAWDEMLSNFSSWEKDVRARGAQNPGEHLFLYTAGYFREQGEKSFRALEASAYQALVQAARGSLPVIHHSCYYQNLIIDPHDQVNLIDFERSKHDLAVHDLAQLINRSARKTKWSLEHGRSLLAGYEEVRRLDPAELQLLRLLLAFPYRYWLCCQKYFRESSGGKWFEEHLAVLIKLETWRQLFLQQIGSS